MEGCPRIWGQGVPIGRNPEAFYTDLFVYCSVPTSYKRISAEVTHHYWWGCIVFLKWVRVENSLFLIVVMILLFCCFKKILFNPLIQITSLLRETINSCLVLGWHNGQLGPGGEKLPVTDLNHTSVWVPTADLLFQKVQGGNGVCECSESSAGVSDRQPGMRASASLVGLLPA